MVRRIHPYRHAPEAVVCFVGKDVLVDEPALRQRHLDSGCVAPYARLQHRIAHLAGPRVHHVGNRLARGCAQGVPEVHGLRIGVLVLRQIVVEARPKIVGADIALQHAKDGGALAVADGVEELLDTGRVVDLLLDGVRAPQAVQAEAPVRVRRYELGPDLPLGIQRIGGLVSHPGREALVEPEVVPPGHRHEVAKPHVRHLVGDDPRDGLPRSGGGIVGVHQKGAFAVGYGAPVLHGPGGEVRYGKVVQLWKRVEDAEILVVVTQQPDRSLQGEPALLLPAPHRKDTHQRSIGGFLLYQGQVAHDNYQEIGRHYGRFAEPHGSLVWPDVYLT